MWSGGDSATAALQALRLRPMGKAACVLGTPQIVGQVRDLCRPKFRVIPVLAQKLHQFPARLKPIPHAVGQLHDSRFHACTSHGHTSCAAVMTGVKTRNMYDYTITQHHARAA